jgi:hypothetical protein
LPSRVTPLTILNSVLDALILAISLAIVVFLYANSDRGLDFTDEGMYLLAVKYPREITATPTWWHWLLAPLFDLTGGDVPRWRQLGVTLTFLSGAAFGWTMAALTARRSGADTFVGRLALAALIGAANLLGYSIFLPTPSYNLLTTWIVNGAALCFVLALQQPASPRHSAWMFVTGLAVGLSFIARFPTTVGLITLFGVVRLLWPGAGLRVRVSALVWLAGGALTALAVFFLLGPNPSDWLTISRRGLELNRIIDGGERLEAIHWRYWKEWNKIVFPGFVEHTRTTSLTALAIGVLVRLMPRGVRRPLASVALAAVFGLFTFWSVRYMQMADPANYINTIAMFYGSWLVVVLGSLPLWTMDRAEMFSAVTHRTVPVDGHPLALALLILMLIALPFANAIGTNNMLHNNLIYSIAPWLAAVAYIMRRSTSAERGVMARVTFAGAAVVCYMQVTLGAQHATYRLNAPLDQQSVATPLGSPPSTLRLDPPTSRFLLDMRQLLSANGFKDDQDLLAFFNMPGVVFAVGGKSPGTYWFNEAYRGSRAFAEYTLKLIGPERTRKSFLIEEDKSHPWIENLDALGVQFPEGYERIGELTIPWSRTAVRIWRPR